jgi:hypothetical protein
VCSIITRGEDCLNELLETLEEALLNSSRPVQVAFHLYEILSEAGYDDECIHEVASSLEDIVA